MDNGFIKVAVPALRVRVADCVYNADQSVEAIKRAAAEGAELAVLPELGITGYTAGDLVLQPLLQAAAIEQTLRVAELTKDIQILSFVGLPLAVGGKLYNAAAALSGGQIIGFVPKTHLPTYGEFFEKRWFAAPSAGVQYVELAGRRIPLWTRLIFKCVGRENFTVAAEICEDIWVSRSPGAEHSGAGAAVIVNLSASNDVVCKADYRRQLVNVSSAKNTGAYVYSSCGSGESTTDAVFGAHRIVAELGKVLAESELFSDEDLYTDIDIDRIASERRKMISSASPSALPEYMTVDFACEPQNRPLTRKFEQMVFVPADPADRAARAGAVFAMQVSGLKTRLEATGIKKLILGVSGGLDSTLALMVSAAALDKLGLDRRNLIAVTMPCFATSARTRGNAERISRAVGADFRTINISRSVTRHLADIGVSPESRGVEYENAQARERTQVLMDIANAENAIVVGTGDLSESALGWCTYAGDHISMYSVNCSVPKTLIPFILRFAAERLNTPAKITDDIIKTPISPELLKSNGGAVQLTEDVIGPYLLHDFFLYYAIRWAYTPKRLFFVAETAFDGIYDGATIARWMRVFYTRFFRNQFKRSCVPDGPKTGSVSLSPRADWRMASDASPALWLAEMDEIDRSLVK